MENNALLEKALLRTLEKNRYQYETLPAEAKRQLDAELVAFVRELRKGVTSSSDAYDIYSTLRVLIQQTHE